MRRLTRRKWVTSVAKLDPDGAVKWLGGLSDSHMRGAAVGGATQGVIARVPPPPRKGSLASSIAVGVTTNILPGVRDREEFGAGDEDVSCGVLPAFLTPAHFPAYMMLLPLALCYVAWFSIGLRMSRSFFKRGGAFAVVVGLIVSIAVPPLASVVCYHDPGGGDMVGPAWKRVAADVSWIRHGGSRLVFFASDSNVEPQSRLTNRSTEPLTRFELNLP